MKVLFTGADGYIGAVLGPKLLKRGYDVVGLDTGYYRRGWLFDDHLTRPQVITKDIRLVTVADLHGVDALVHLAELSNDPLGENDPDLTMAINFRGSVALAEQCRAAGVKRFVYASSCSVYGAGGSGVKTEESDANPQTTYSRCKVLVEQVIKQMSDRAFATVCLRNATAFGASPRQRFDLVLNNLAGWAWTHHEIRMISDGSPWRPLVHIEDICEAILCAIAAPQEAVGGQTFNVGDNTQNYRIRDIAEVVAAAFPGCKLTFGTDGGDNRSYRVSFDKIRAHMPKFRCRWNAARGAAQLRSVFERIVLTSESFDSCPYTRLKELQYLKGTHQVNEQLYWTPIFQDGIALPEVEVLNGGQAASLSEITEIGSGQDIPNVASS